MPTIKLYIRERQVDELVFSFAFLDTKEERQAHVDGLVGWLKSKHVLTDEPWHITVDNITSRVEKVIHRVSPLEILPSKRKKKANAEKIPKPIKREKGRYSNPQWLELF